MRVRAARKLVERTNPGDPLAGERFLAGAAASGIDVSRMWASIDRDEEVRQVCLGVVGAGRTAMLFVTAPAETEDRDELGAVVRTACQTMDGVVLAQALLDVGNEAMESALARGGLQRLTRLLYLKRALGKRDAMGPGGDWPPGVEVIEFARGTTIDLERALERSYMDTADCPELCGMRSTADVVASHKSIGKWDPHLWFTVRLGGEPHGALLMNPCPDQGVVELVYLGLSPDLRGNGLGSRVLEWGLSRVAHRAERTMMCAVDERNMAARRVYERAGFREFDARVAMVCAVGRGVDNHAKGR
jgi:ribosomal protein S18 acetylase RimI-like enzyme